MRHMRRWAICKIYEETYRETYEDWGMAALIA
jgi:hypothetical protein